MAIQHTKKYGVYYWDTFDNETMLVHEGDSFDDVAAWIEREYCGRLFRTGADRIEIVDDAGSILSSRGVR